jgi:hypothetical protein
LVEPIVSTLVGRVEADTIQQLATGVETIVSTKSS